MTHLFMRQIIRHYTVLTLCMISIVDVQTIHTYFKHILYYAVLILRVISIIDA